MGFLYFLPSPNARAVTPQEMIAAGLGYALGETNHVAARHTTAGPGGPGHIISCDEKLEPIYKASEQTWRPGKAGKFHVGYITAQKPGPADLAREKVYDGQKVRLLDGNDWVVPRCFAILENRSPTLPRQLDLAADGETVVTRIHPRFEKLCDDAFTWWQIWSGQSKTEMSGSAMIDLAIDALAVNYRLGKLEALALLQLFSTDEHGLVLRAIIDADEVEAYIAASKQKKSTSAAGASKTSSGVTESSPDTGRALQI